MQFLDIHFLDVGNGDCTFVEYADRLTMIDVNNCKSFGKESEDELRKKYRPAAPNPLLMAGIAALGGAKQPPPPPNPFFNSVSGGLYGLGQPSQPAVSLLAQAAEAERRLKEAKDHLTNPIDYFKAKFTGRFIFRYIQSHPDMDHMAGLHRLWEEEKIQIVNFWDTKHCIEKDEVAMATGEVNHDVEDWHTYLKIRKSVENPKVLHLITAAKGNFYTADGIHVWAPFDHSHENNADCNPNDLSYLLHIGFGKCSIVLGGDTTAENWETFYERVKSAGKSLPKVNLLKASHHGRKSGYHMASVREMNPDLTIMSVGELKAKDDATASYERYSKCFSTLDHGDIIARCWIDGEIRLYDRDGKQLASSWS